MSWVIGNVLDGSYSVKKKYDDGTLESYRVVYEHRNRKYHILHIINKPNGYEFAKEYLKKTFDTSEEARNHICKLVDFNEDSIIKIPYERFEELKQKHYPDYIGKAIARHEFQGRVCEAGDWCGMAGILTDDYENSTSLLFEHIHFEIV